MSWMDYETNKKNQSSRLGDICTAEKEDNRRRNLNHYTRGNKGNIQI